MRRVSFKHGIHPPEKKETTRSKPIEDFPLPKKVIIPLSQHTGRPNESIVKKGERVETGQLIGETSAFISSPVHASLSGIVSAIEPRPHPLGMKVQSVVIESDEKDEWISASDAVQGSPDNIKDLIKSAGIAGLGGAAFPTHVKLSPPANKKIEFLIINGAECEPYLTSDERVMLEYSAAIVEGIEILKKVLGVEKVVLGIELNKPECIAAMSKAVQGKDIEIVGLKTKYPQGGEKQLIKAILGREVPRRGLPLDVGCVVQNVGTVVAVRDAVIKKKPLIERVVTVTGSAVEEPKNLRVRIGTPFIELLNFCNFQKDSAGKVIMGGPMMGISQHNLDVPVIKGTSGILAMKKEEVIEYNHRQCIRCARCVESCPVYLMPYEISLASESDRFDIAEKLGVFDCIECGVCGYVCPATRHMTHLMKKAKTYANFLKSSRS
ncbi:MAG: electron transport complex subunit RsxC [Candidatus Omnitrophica bacterium]|nr:electron transport complex subunit RsxC [Candidatus Omnitrophota bacterium]